MILILLGTQDKPFTRLLKAIDKAIDDGFIKEKVIAQIGFTKYSSKNIETFELIPNDQYEEIINKADLIITHAGIGSILTGLKRNKKIIATARLKEYGEHTNNHQLQILTELANKGYIIRLDDFSQLPETIEKARNFKPNKYKSNNQNFVKIVEDYIDSL
ncbi:MAG: PssE/Cps14G family polysaccharide biosynthesis glycosyltransferase [Bacilli bacterium]